MPEHIWLTYRELGERLGISPDGARMKAKRNKWTATTDNEGNIRVCVPADLSANNRTNVPPRTRPERSTEQTNEIKALQAHIETLKQQVSDHAAERERLREQLDQQRADHAAERQLLRNEIHALKAELATERQHARDLAGRLDQAHRDHRADLERVRAEMEQRRRPWWRRWR